MSLDKDTAQPLSFTRAESRTWGGLLSTSRSSGCCSSCNPSSRVLTKPFSLAELVARIRAVLRRAQKGDDGDLLAAGAIKLDLRRHCAFKGGTELQLTDTEFRILALLLKRRGEVVTRDDFLKHVWGEDVYVTHRTVDTHVAALRKKIEDDLEHPAYILSVRNVGYRFNEDITPS